MSVRHAILGSLGLVSVLAACAPSASQPPASATLAPKSALTVAHRTRSSVIATDPAPLTVSPPTHPTSPPSPARAAARFSCADIATLDSLSLQRTAAFPQDHLHFTIPNDIHVTDAGRARTAARALCALPAFPMATVVCPADFGVTYRLIFAADGWQRTPVIVSASGCEPVTGIGGTLWAVPSPGFWSALGTAIGRPNAGFADFEGTLPG